MASGGEERKRVSELVHGDVTAEFGVVTHREGRKVWFESRVVTFNTVDDEVRVLADADGR